ncbi:MAG: FAD-binding oxidoreductase [Gammaproteobacteria bacterium]|jgi:decaprenylphospho-beta-D-ribofuranose 2-oxidase
MKVNELEISGWGRLPRATARVVRPERLTAAVEAVKARPEGGLVARGGGRSYGDAALNDGGHVLLTRRLDRILAFDREEAQLVSEPGVTIAELQSFLVPLGFTLPAVPGTGFATLGGAVANDVHGKNHDRHGSLGDHLQWFDLLTADGAFRRVSAADEPDLFAATIGGIGLTGILMTICVSVLPCPSNAVRVTEMRADDLDHFLTLLAQHRDRETYSVGWIDTLARGARFGRGILEVAEPSERPVEARPPRSLRVPMDMPGFVLNRWSISAMNAWYYSRVPSFGRDRVVPLETFFHPLDSVLDWNRMYGRAGFRQFQCVIPDDRAPVGIRCLLEAVTESRAGSFLAVLKTMGGEGRGHLSFPMRGFTLALDFPARAGLDALMGQLEAITLEHGGRVYLAKDSCLSPEGFARMYPKLPELRQTLDRVDPDRLFVSDMARRLDIRGEL